MKETDPSTKADKLLQDAENALNQTLALTKDCLGEKIESTVDDLLNNSRELNEVLSTGPGPFDSNQYLENMISNMTEEEKEELCQKLMRDFTKPKSPRNTKPASKPKTVQKSKSAEKPNSQGNQKTREKAQNSGKRNTSDSVKSSEKQITGKKLQSPENGHIEQNVCSTKPEEKKERNILEEAASSLITHFNPVSKPRVNKLIQEGPYVHLSRRYLFQTSAVNEYYLHAKYPAIYSALKGPLDDDKDCNPVVKRNVQNMAKEVAKREQKISKKSPVNNHPSGISTSTKTSEQRSTFGCRENTGR